MSQLGGPLLAVSRLAPQKRSLTIVETITHPL